MKRWLILFCMLLGSASIWAQSDELAQKQKLAKELIEATDTIADVKKVMSQVSSVMRQQFMTDIQRRSPQMTPYQAGRVGDVFSKIIEEEVGVMMSQIMPMMMKSIESMYVSKFSLEELTEIHRFTLSPVGRKHQTVAINELPQLMAPMMGEMSTMGQRLVPRLIPRLQAAMRQLSEEGVLPKTQ